MRYDGTKIVQTNSGYESLGFESFDRDGSIDALCSCINSCCDADTALSSAVSLDWCAQGTSSRDYSTTYGKINDCVSSISSVTGVYEKALKNMAAALGYEFDDNWNLKEKNRGNRLLRSQLRTLQKGTL